jgi:hypothetical protein
MGKALPLSPSAMLRATGATLPSSTPMVMTLATGAVLPLRGLPAVVVDLDAEVAPVLPHVSFASAPPSPRAASEASSADEMTTFRQALLSPQIGAALPPHVADDVNDGVAMIAADLRTPAERVPFGAAVCPLHAGGCPFGAAGGLAALSLRPPWCEPDPALLMPVVLTGPLWWHDREDH